ncbi:putative DNA-binding transcriptional regulator YafY [Flavobacterium sp. PL11]|jgi:predicted DNA-binding transcriptional regulator YafY|uniref:HTH domain-containing protein n=1 Tax=Flavobacterium sp. PL11 TaxID=3071717 RepID=UPI002DF797EE|nr:putative DNA-binding transcriptional regulator YafY [Flavobacterium sp. PL11]
MDIRTIIRIHDCIKNSWTGTPKELSEKLEVSERTLYNYISFMKNDLKAPIEFCKVKRRYQYNRECSLKFENE